MAAREVRDARATGPPNAIEERFHDYSSDQIASARKAAGNKGSRALKRADVEIALIDRRNHHIFQPLLYQVATAGLSPAEIAAPIRQLETKNLSVLLAEVKGINLGTHTVEVT